MSYKQESFLTKIDLDKVLLVFGPPGTGKTTHLSHRVTRAVDQYGAENIIIASYTKTAAKELNSRNLPISKDQIGTLHSFCYRGLGKPSLAETKIEEWNETVTQQYKLTNQKDDRPTDESSADLNAKIDNGDALLSDYNTARAMMLDPERWPLPLKAFADKWEAWKSENDYCDFTDLITRTLEEDRPAPDDPRIGIFDEAQDFSPLQLALIAQWSKYMDYCMLAGDDDQTLYQWAGASADSLVSLDIDEKRKTILKQSYRVPKAVRKLAMDLIRRIPDDCRQVKDYEPTECEGEISRSTASYKNPISLFGEIDDSLNQDKTIMILAACGYQLKPMIKELRSRGYLFHNPYRRKNGAWNPIKYSKRSTNNLERLQEFLKAESEDFPWKSTANIWTWIKDIHAKILHHDAKQRLKQEENDFKDFDDMADYLRRFVLNPEGWQSFIESDNLHQWFMDNVLNSRKRGYEYPSNVVRLKPCPPAERPKIIIGTIHSVKGAEADSVVLFPDISLQGQRAAISPEGRYDLYRQFYVGITRTRDRLTICNPGDRWFLRI